MCARQRATAIALLALAGVLAVSSLLGDSATFDETGHLVAGMSHWRTGDYRLIPDHPPLAKMWATLPLLVVPHRWPEATEAAWVDLDWFELGRQWLFDLNDGQRLLVLGRGMIVVLLLTTCAGTAALSARTWGPGGALLTLALATLSPTLLAHGRLVTTDMAITACVALTLLAFARLLDRVSWGRLAAAAAALGAASVAKFSWPLLVPAVAAMGLAAVLRRRAPEPALWPGRGESSRRRLAAHLAAAALVTALVVWASIWTAYRWRYDALAPLRAGATQQERTDLARARARLDERRAQTLLGPGSVRVDAIAATLRVADAHRLLPEAYVLGLAEAVELTASRRAYLMGEYGLTGWRSYFPIAFAIKTPLGTQLLILAGVAALVLGRARPRDGALLVGLLVYAAVASASLIGSRLNIGHRHMLPLYPVLFVLAGAATAWLGRWPGRLLVGGAVAWLAVATISIHPHYLAYFNEAIGGPARGHLYLADSNIDWGQDLLRLRDYARAHPDEPVKLAYFGSARPTYYLPCAALPSHHAFAPRAELTSGIYAVSATQLLGVYFEEARDEYWRLPAVQAEYARLAARPPEGAARAAWEEVRGFRLINRLRHRDPDARVGWSLFVYHLDDAELRRLLAPGEDTESPR